MDSVSNNNNIFIVDVGSTTTKGLLLEKKGESYFFKALADASTTVEEPFEDVNIGLSGVIEKIEDKSGVRIRNSDGSFSVPFLATSSAGGGLQMLVFGLTRSETGKAVEATAYGAGAVVIGSFTVDDGIMETDKMRMIRELHPDMILMAGGIDGGGLWGVLRQAEILTLASPQPKFMSEEKIPLVYCGNVLARDFVKDILGKHFLVHITDNIRPDLESFNLDPVRSKVHNLFMENVMENAPGYKKIKEEVFKDILPTPSAVELILKKYYSAHSENTFLVDIGGATTDVFSCVEGSVSRTVSANTGMSYSISNILKESGVDTILSRICRISDERTVRDYISNKMLNPEYIPVAGGERFVELGCAAEGIKIARDQHIGMSMEVKAMGYLDKRRRTSFEGTHNPFEEVFNLKGKKDVAFQFSDINRIIGCGGMFTSSKKDEDAVFLLSEGFSPQGITEFYIDRHFRSPHLGLLSTILPDAASELFEKETLEKICTVLSVTGKSEDSGVAIKITDSDSKEKAELKEGEVFYIKKGGSFIFETAKGCSFGNNGSRAEIKTKKGILLDARLNEIRKAPEPLFRALYGEVTDTGFSYSYIKGRNEIYNGEFEITRSLPYKGDIIINPGEKVGIETVIAQNLFNPPKIYMMNIRKLVGLEEKLSNEDIIKGLLVKKGDIIDFDMPVFRHKKRKDPIAVDFLSNISGEVVKIDDYGMIVVKEVQDYSEEPVVIDIASEMNIKPKDIKKYLKRELGDFIQKGQIIAARTTGNSVRDLINQMFDHKTDRHEGMVQTKASHYSVRSNSTGHITAIDTEKGTVTVKYRTKPLILRSFVNGTVSAVHKNISVDIKVNGSYAYCIIGFGGENFGKIAFPYDGKTVTETNEGDVVVFTRPINKRILENARDMKVKGVIAPSVHNIDWVEFCGREIGIAVTGKEDIGFTLMLTEGFGNKEMNSDYQEYFRQNEGKTASLNGRTQIRAGVIRPRVIIS